MKMETVKTQRKCDFCGCNKLAKFSFSTKGFFKHDLAFCEDCMKEMFECISKICIPKPVEAPFKNKRKREER